MNPDFDAMRSSLSFILTTEVPEEKLYQMLINATNVLEADDKLIKELKQTIETLMLALQFEKDKNAPTLGPRVNPNPPSINRVV